MGSTAKHSLTSETSSEESDQPEKFKDETISTVGRFYECNFCKRGFTNAQALGGHMNIHRKDRAKAKQKISSTSSFSDKSGEEWMNNYPRYFEHFSSDHPQHFAVPMGGQVNYQLCFPSSNPNFSLGNHHHDNLSDSAAPRTEHLSLFEDHKTPNLSMQIDYSDYQEDSESRKNISWNENDLDLELRLG